MVHILTFACVLNFLTTPQITAQKKLGPFNIPPQKYCTKFTETGKNQGLKGAQQLVFAPWADDLGSVTFVSTVKSKLKTLSQAYD